MTRPTRDLFAPVVPLDTTHLLFQHVRQGPGHEAARQMMNEVFAEFQDVDKSFVREFQTAGFSARVFELALFAYLQEQACDLGRTHAAPDFVIRGDTPVAIEVTTTNPRQDAEPDDNTPPTLWPADMPTAERAFVFQLGKALRRKLLHRDAQGHAYWEKSHVAGVPFVIAVGAFHDQHVQIHPVGLLAEYLYGTRSVAHHDETGKLTITPEGIAEHHSAGKTISSGLFRQPEATNLTGVLFSNAHTIAMFNRIGTERGLGSPDTAMCRVGTRYDPDPNASKPLLFGYVVGDRPAGEQETFAEGLELFLNPWATTPLSPEALPMVTCHELLDNGNVMTTSYGKLQPFTSKTSIHVGEHAQTFARYDQLSFLGRVPPLTEKHP